MGYLHRNKGCLDFAVRLELNEMLLELLVTTPLGPGRWRAPSLILPFNHALRGVSLHNGQAIA